MENQLFDTEHLPRTYFNLSVPVVIGMIISVIYNLADTFFVARTGDINLVAGVSLCAPVFTTLMAFGNIYGQGGSSVISRLLGQNKTEESRQVSSFCFYIAIVTGLIIGVIMLLFRSPLLTLFGADSETYVHAMPYYTILAVGSPFVVLNFIHMNLLRCEGYSKQSMYGTILGSVVNIILDPIMISAFGWGAGGAALASVIGYISSDVFLFVFVVKRSRCLSVDIRLWKTSRENIGQIFGIGITAALANLMSSAATIMMNRFLLPYGNDKIGAMGIVLKVNMIAQLLITGFAFGGVPLFGYLYGAKLKEKINELIRFCLLFLGSIALLLSLLIFVFSPTLIHLFMDTGSVVQDGSLMLRIQVIGNVFAAITLLTTVLFQATGKVIPAFIMSISRQGVVYFLTLAVLSLVLGYQGILWAQAAADILSAMIGVLLYYRFFMSSAGKNERSKE